MSGVVQSQARRIRTAEPGVGFEAHRDEILAAVARVLDRGRFILGPEVEGFEREFAAYVGIGHAVGVGSGTAALELALRALSIGPGDAVFTVSHTSVATVAAIELAGARPVLVDIDPASFTMDPVSLDAAIRSVRDGRHGLLRPAAVLPVHLYGHPAPMAPLCELARRQGLRIVEDASQAHGARIGGTAVGTFGEVAAFSLYPTKNLGAMGDAGVLVCRDGTLEERVRRLRQYGWSRPQHSEEPGTNSRLDELQAAILRIRLSGLEPENDRRRQLAGLYSAALSQRLLCPATVAGCTHVFHQYVVRTANRGRLMHHLAEAGIDAAVHYPTPVHLQPGYRGRVALAPDGLPVTEAVSGQILSLPVHPHLTEEDLHRVIAAVESFPGSLSP